MSKRMFEIFDEMNVEDIKEGSQLVMTSGNFLNGCMSKKGSRITFGAPSSVLMDMNSGKKLAILVVVDKEEYFKRKDAREIDNEDDH